MAEPLPMKNDANQPEKQKFGNVGKFVYFCRQKIICIMCTYNIILNDALVEKARPAFPDDKALQRWLQEQVSAALERFLSKQTETESAQKAMVKESLTTAFNELHLGQAKKNARSLFAQ